MIYLWRSEKSLHACFVHIRNVNNCCRMILITIRIGSIVALILGMSGIEESRLNTLPVHVCVVVVVWCITAAKKTPVAMMKS
jgi:flagellar biosynthesis protein FliQ